MVQSKRQEALSRLTSALYFVQFAGTVTLKVAVSGSIDKIATSDFAKYSIEAFSWAAIPASIGVATAHFYGKYKKSKQNYRASW